MKQYRFSVQAKLTKNGSKQLLSNIIATSIVDAKNKVKAMYPDAEIYSCVKSEEYIDLKKQTTQNKSTNEDNSSSFGGMLLGAAITAGIGYFLKKK